MSERGMEFGMHLSPEQGSQEKEETEKPAQAESVPESEPTPEKLSAFAIAQREENRAQVEDREKKEGQPPETSIHAIFAAKFKGRPYEESARKLDEQGNLLKLEVFLVNEKGERIEMTYHGASSFGEKRGSIRSTIEIAYYDADGIPEGGSTVADYVDGVWQQK